ncbi:hypothetical protein ACFE04_030851 [Oxalis oulophora]
MAIEIFSEILSPRISFSQDLHNSDDQENQTINKSESDFDFCFVNNKLSLHQEFSSADELFSNGKILPGNQILLNKKPPQENPFPNPTTQQKKRLKELLSIDFEEQKPSKSFWQFKRSTSLNHESTRSKGLIRSLLLSRSNSTGSTPNPKPIKEIHQKNYTFQRQGSKSYVNYYNNNSSTLRPPLRKCASYNNNNGGFRISPVLNIPPPASFFGLGSLFCYNKNKKKKR